MSTSISPWLRSRCAGVHTVEQLARADTDVRVAAFGPRIGPSLKIH
jgi:hypothetical protein